MSVCFCETTGRARSCLSHRRRASIPTHIQEASTTPVASIVRRYFRIPDQPAPSSSRRRRARQQQKEEDERRRAVEAAAGDRLDAGTWGQVLESNRAFCFSTRVWSSIQPYTIKTPNQPFWPCASSPRFGTASSPRCCPRWHGQDRAAAAAAAVEGGEAREAKMWKRRQRNCRFQSSPHGPSIIFLFVLNTRSRSMHASNLLL